MALFLRASAALFFSGLMAFASPAATAAIANGKLPEAFVVGNQVRVDLQVLARLYFELAADLRTQGIDKRSSKTRALQLRLLLDVDQGMARLVKLELDDKGRKLQKRLADKWTDARPLLAAPYAAGNADLAYAVGEELYIASSNLMYHLEDLADSELGKLVDISGRLTGISERIARAAYHSLVSGRHGALVDFIAWRKEFEEGLALLEASPANDEYQKQNLFLGRAMWGLFDSLVTGVQRRQTGLRPVDIGKSADGIREVFTQSQRGYEQEMRRQLASAGRNGTRSKS